MRWLTSTSEPVWSCVSRSTRNRAYSARLPETDLREAAAGRARIGFCRISRALERHVLDRDPKAVGEVPAQLAGGMVGVGAVDEVADVHLGARLVVREPFDPEPGVLRTPPGDRSP